MRLRAAVGTRFYLVEFFRRGQEIYEARASAPRLALCCTVDVQVAAISPRSRPLPLARTPFSGSREPTPANVIASAKLQVRAQRRD
jgi:hypothetical protein